MSIDKLFSLVQDEGSYHFGPEWSQGRTAFGGATAAIMCHSVLPLPSEEKYLISLSITFCAPVNVEAVINTEVEILRRGRTLELYSIKAYQEGRLCAHAIAVFSRKIASSIDISAVSAPSMPENINISNQQFALGSHPRFVENFDFRFFIGDPLFSGSSERQHLVGINYKDPPAPWSLAHLVCLMDACPPTPAQQLKESHPLSTIVWNIHFLPEASSFEPTNGVIMSTFGEASIDGANYLSERLWSPNGVPLAFSTQSVLIFG